jgi:amino acid transporter
MALVGGEAANELNSLGYKQELKRSLSLADLIVYGLVFISPIAPWAVFGFVYNLSKGMAPLVYIVGLAAMLFTALSYMSMVHEFPVAGSVYAYAGRALAPWVGFLAGWGILLDYLLIPGLAYVIAAVAMHEVWPAVPQWAWVTAFVVGVTGVNLAGIETTTGTNKILLLIQCGLLLAFVVLAAIAVSHGVSGAHVSMSPLFQASVISPQLIFGALSVAALSFLGFDAISTLAEEAHGGAKAISRATILSLLIVALLFALQTYLASLFVLGKPTFAPGEASAAAFINITGLVGGAFFRTLASLGGLALSAVAGAVVGQAAAARLIYSMARDRKLPRFFAHVHEKKKSPDRAVLLLGAISLAIGISVGGNIELLASLVNFGALTGFLLLHVSVLVHFAFKRRDRLQWFRHVVSPVLGFLVIGYVIWSMDPHAKLLGLCWLAVGSAVLIWLKFTGKPVALIGDA